MLYTSLHTLKQQWHFVATRLKDSVDKDKIKYMRNQAFGPVYL